MITFAYTIKEKTGIHARPAGLIAKLAREFESEIIIENNGKSVNAQKLIMLMSLGVKCGDTVRVSVSGSDEKAAAEKTEAFFRENL